MPNNTINKFCPIIKDKCRTDCMFSIPIVDNKIATKYECSLACYSRDIAGSLYYISEHYKNLQDPEYVELIKGE